MSRLSQYAENQRARYSEITQTLTDAKNAVGPNYDSLRREAVSYVEYMIAQYRLRKGQFSVQSDQFSGDLRVLDFACGVGRVMEACREVGIVRVDGCDISQEMISHAKSSSSLVDSDFFLSSGFDAGNAPLNHYDIAYSFLCFHHIPMRQTRIKLLESLSRSLKPGGMVFIEFKVFPGATEGRIPANHSHWTENRPARHTNSGADVWITPDSMGQVIEDFRLFFNDIGVQEVELGNDLYEYDPDAIYQLGFNELFVIATKGAGMKNEMRTRS